MCKFEIVKNVSARAYSGCAPGAVSILEVVSFCRGDSERAVLDQSAVR